MESYLTQDNATSLAKRVKKTDAREIESFYQAYYEHYVRALDQGEQADRYLRFSYICFLIGDFNPYCLFSPKTKKNPSFCEKGKKLNF